MKLVTLFASATSLCAGSITIGGMFRGLTLWALLPGVALWLAGMFFLSAVTFGYWFQVSTAPIVGASFWHIDHVQRVTLTGLFLVAICPGIAMAFGENDFIFALFGFIGMLGTLCLLWVFDKANFLTKARQATRYN